MLARANRITEHGEFRVVARSGRRVISESLVVKYCSGRFGGTPRFGFVVSKSVGTAVTRNRVKRRLRAIARLEISRGLTNSDFVVRALPAAAEASWSSLQSELSAAVAHYREAQ